MTTRKDNSTKKNASMTAGMATGMGGKKRPKAKANTPVEPAAAAPGNIGPAVTEEQKEEIKNQYAPKQKIGVPTLGRKTSYVTTVGLGNLEVRTADGTTDT